LQHFGFTQFGDDLLGCVSSSFWHFLPPFPLILSFYLDQFLGGSSPLSTANVKLERIKQTLASLKEKHQIILGGDVG
jgi:hypothetical protein